MRTRAPTTVRRESGTTMNLRLTVTAAIATIAASTALHPLIAAGGWFWEGAGAVAVVAGVASLTRLRPLPVLVCLAGSILGLLLYVNLVFSSQRSFGGVLPTLASLAGLARLNAVGWSEAARYAPPVPGRLGVTFLAVAGIGLAAVVTDLLAVRLRKAAMAGLPLLALFSATVASKANTPTINEILIFCAGVAGFLVLLVTDAQERIQLWGRLVAAREAGRLRPAAPPQPATGVPDTRGLAAAGRRIGTAAIVAALLVPVLVPGLHTRNLFGGGQGPGVAGGTVLASLPAPLDQLNSQLHRSRPLPILTYRTNNPDPPYLRVYSLELSQTGANWLLVLLNDTALRSDGKLAAPPGLRNAPYRLTTTNVTVARGVRGAIGANEHTQSFLPMPYPAVSVQAGSGWFTDPTTLMVWSVNPIGGLNYSVKSKIVVPTQQELRRYLPPPTSIIDEDLAVPAIYNSLSGLAQSITSSAPTPYDKAIKLQQWFTTPGRFTYSLNASEANNPTALKDFLLHSRRGFCQQFAFAFAVLARLLNIPARVAVGYTAGTNMGNGNYRVTTSDAHAWPELYFQGVGWLAWEPTPAGNAAGQGTAKAPAYTIPPGGANPSGANPSTGSGSGSRSNQQGGAGVGKHQRFAPVSNGGGGQGRHRSAQWRWWLAGLAALALIVALTPLAARLATRCWRLLIIEDMVGPGRVGRRARGKTGTSSGSGTPGTPGAAEGGPADAGVDGVVGAAAAGGASAAADGHLRARIHAGWLEVEDDLEDFGVGCPAHESPRAVLRRVTAQLRLQPAPRDALRRIAYAEERARYATRTDALPTLRRDLTAVRRAIASSVRPRARWRGRIFPASKVSTIGRSGRHALDVFGWIDVGTSWLWAHLRPAERPGAGRAAS